MEVGHNIILDSGGLQIEYQFYFDIIVFPLYGLILLSLLIVPSKKRIMEMGIVHVSPFVLKVHYLLGAMAIIMAGVLMVLFYYSDYSELLNVFNTIILLPVGILLIANSYSTGKLVGQMGMEDEGFVVGEVEEETVMAAEVAPTRRRTPGSAAPMKPKAERKVITIQCPGCDKYLKIEYAGEGQEIKCPACGLEGEL